MKSTKSVGNGEYMPRKRDPQIEKSVIQAAWSLFGERGYNATSYSDIAALSHVPRANVQTYFPKKGIIAARILEVLRDESIKAARNTFPEKHTLFEQHCLHGQIYIQTIMRDNSFRRFFSDLLEDRKLINELIERDYMWSAGFVNSAPDETVIPEESLQDVQVNMGGLYELMYHCITTGTNFDVWKRLRPGYRDLARFIGIGPEQADLLIEETRIAPEELDKLSKAVLRAVKKDIAAVK